MRAAALVAFGAMLISACVALASCALFGPAERTAVEKDTATIGGCQEVGRACQADGGHDCYAQYDACTRDAGLR